MTHRIALAVTSLSVTLCLAACSAETVDTADPVTIPSNEVVFGDPSLTAGIPGDGPLSVPEIHAWLNQPYVHGTLTAALPLGLSTGAGSEVGLDENPLTRAKIELGRQFFFDTRLSADGTVSCASCHDPDTGYAAHTRFGEGIRGQTGNRNSPTAYNRILSGPQFWDGRAASLEEQAVGPIENPIEMGNTHEACMETVQQIPGYVVQLERIFGEVTIDAVGKALAAFERVIVTGPSPFDYHEDAQRYADVTDEELAEDPEFAEQVRAARDLAAANPMGESAVRGRELFFGKANCTACHVGPNLTDETYRNLGVGMSAEEPDLGRYEITKVEKDKGAFKTPTIRNVEQTAPYMHDGSVATLEEVVELYDRGGEPNPWLDEKVVPLNLTDQEKADLVAFMKACTGPLPPVERGRLPAGDTPPQ